jgi:two-component system response regulator FlrC
MKRVLVVDDEEGIRTFIGEVLEGEGHKVTLARDGAEAAQLLERQSFHLMITDLKMPRLDGMSLLRKARAEQPEMEVIVLTAHGTVASAVEAMKLGAADYLTKPLANLDELRIVAAKALERRELRDEGQRSAARKAERAGMIAVDPAMRAVAAQIAKVAATDATVLLLGESGSGKEVAARTIHEQSPRAAGPFVAVNCAVLSEHLIESEMFGHEKGAFTGAAAQRRGRFELADSGTLFLDEVAELQPSLQAKLLRVLEERAFERIGGTRTIEVDIRLVAATNRDLAKEMQEGRLREDLYHRLAVFPVRLPPLRERPGDIAPLAEYLLGRIGIQLRRPGLALDEGAREALLAHSWPGNVRELANVLERAAILADGPVIPAALLNLVARPGVAATAGGGGATIAPGATLRDLEREAIRQTLAATGGHRKKTAETLGIGLRTLYEKLKEYDLG